MSVRLYRIQDADGRGPYKRGFAERWLDQDDSYFERQPPGPDQFGLSVYSIVSGHAFRSIEQMCRWFTPSEMDRLDAFGYLPVSMIAKEVVAESPNQVLFWRAAPLNKGALIIPWPHRVTA